MPAIATSTEAVFPGELDPPQPEEAMSQNVIPPTPSSSQVTSSQVPITDPASVSGGPGAKGKQKGRAAKRARNTEEVTQTNTAVTYLDVENHEPVSGNSSVPAYLTKPALTTLLIDDLRKPCHDC